jgi:hypothetical protein
MDEARHQSFSSAGFPLQQDGRDSGMAHGVEARQVPDLGTQALERWGLTDQTVEGVGRGRRASTSHGHLRGGAWPGERLRPTWLKTAEIG